jgi:tetratricopeptide (TPR) repeat protein
VWQRAVDTDKPDRAAEDKYESEMRQGDEHAILAAASSASRPEVKRQLQLAIASYRAAALAKPRAGEPHFRIGKLVYSFYFDCTDAQSRRFALMLCDPRTFDREKAKEVIAAWDAFEVRSPLDPRLSVTLLGETEILFDRAILHTKLASKADLAAAAIDYEKLLARHDGDDGATNRVLGNLAETYMMLGRMEDAIETYKRAVGGGDTSTWYGYAVALDRDESSRQALEIIRALGQQELERFVEQVNVLGSTFFVPEGEKYYYFALAKEAFGFDEEAIDNWQRFIRSGAHPEFQPRAKAHLDALNIKKKRRAIPIEPPWPELFR